MKEFQVRVFYPTSERDWQNLQHRISKAHIEAVTNCINGLSCPNEQKIILINRIIEKSAAS